MTRRFLRQPVAVAALVVFFALFAGALVGGAVGPYRYDDVTDDLAQSPSWAHPMGTDDIGHDMLAQVMRGTERSVRVALMVTVVATAIGGTLGALAGYYRGWADTLLSRLVDFVLTIPVLAILLVVAGRVSVARRSTVLLALVIAGVTWPGIYRVARGTVLSLRERTWAEAARALGATERHVVLRHLLPNAAGPIVVSATLTVAWAILAESALSFLGFGVPSPDVSLGQLVDKWQVASTTRPWLFYFPGLVLLVLCLCVNFVGDGLLAALDPARPGVSPSPRWWRRRPPRPRRLRSRPRCRIGP